MHKCVSSMFEWYASALLAPCLFPLLTVNLAMFPTHSGVTNMSETSETKRIISKKRSCHRFNLCGDNVFGVFGVFFFKAAKSQPQLDDITPARLPTTSCLQTPCRTRVLVEVGIGSPLEAVDKNNLINWWPTLLGTNISTPKTLFDEFFPVSEAGRYDHFIPGGVYRYIYLVLRVF